MSKREVLAYLLYTLAYLIILYLGFLAPYPYNLVLYVVSTIIYGLAVGLGVYNA